MKRKILLVATLFISLLAYGQDASKVSEILETPELTRAQASYLAATWLSPENETLDYDAAAKVIVEAGLFKEGLDMNEPITLAELSGLFMKTWEVPGGLFYRLTKADRYAYKELKARRFLATTDDPSFLVTGVQGLNIMYKCMELNNPVILED